MKRNRGLAPAILAVALVFGSWVSAQAQSEITLLAPRPMQKTIDKILANFQAKTSYKVKPTYDSAKYTRQTVAKGKGLDVNLIVAPFPGAIASGTIDPGSATHVASFLTALAVPKGAPHPDISTPAAVKKALLAAKSIGFEDPDFTVAGQGPWEAITNLGIADQVATKSKITLGPGGAGVAPSATANTVGTERLLQSGDLGIALLLLSDMLPNKDKIDIVGVLPRKICTPSAVVGFIGTKAGDPAAAKALLQYMASPDAQSIFKEDGYEPHS